MDESWSMPFGDTIYTHAPEPRAMATGTVQPISDAKRKRRPRRIGFRPPPK